MTFIANMSIVILFVYMGLIISEDPELQAEYEFFNLSFPLDRVTKDRKQLPINQTTVTQLQSCFRKHNFNNVTWEVDMPSIVTVAWRGYITLACAVPNLVVQKLTYKTDTVYLRRHPGSSKRFFLLEKHEIFNVADIVQVAEVADILDNN